MKDKHQIFHNTIIALGGGKEADIAIKQFKN